MHKSEHFGPQRNSHLLVSAKSGYLFKVDTYVYELIWAELSRLHKLVIIQNIFI